MNLQVLNFPQGGEEWEKFRMGKLTASKFNSVFCGGDVAHVELTTDVPSEDIKPNALRMIEVLNHLRSGVKLKRDLNASGLNGLKKRGVIREFNKTTLRLSSSHDAHINRLICENMFTSTELGDSPPSYAMERGSELEPLAREQFQKIMGIDVTEVGSVRDLDFSDMVSISPDGLTDFTRNEAGFIDSIRGGWEVKCPYPQTHLGYLREGRLPTDYLQQVHGSMAITGADYWWFMSYCPKLQPLILKITRNEYTDQVRGLIKMFLARYDEVLSEVQRIGEEAA